MTFEDIRALVLAWPGAEDGTSYGTPALKARGKLLTRLREDGDTLVLIGVEPDERDLLLAVEPDVFYLTDHYRGWPMVLVRLSAVGDAAVSAKVAGLLYRRWRAVAPKTLVRRHEASTDPPGGPRWRA